MTNVNLIMRIFFFFFYSKWKCFTVPCCLLAFRFRFFLLEYSYVFYILFFSSLIYCCIFNSAFCSLQLIFSPHILFFLLLLNFLFLPVVAVVFFAILFFLSVASKKHKYSLLSLFLCYLKFALVFVWESLLNFH